MSVGQNERREVWKCCIAWLLLRVSVRILRKKSEGGYVCAEKSRGKDYLKQFCSLVHFGPAADHIPEYTCSSVIAKVRAGPQKY